MDEISRYLHGLMGRGLVYDGVPCRLIEVLSDGPTLVLMREDARGLIQPNQFGEARRRVPQTYHIPLRSQVANDLHPVVRALLSTQERVELAALLGLPGAE